MFIDDPNSPQAKRLIAEHAARLTARRKAYERHIFRRGSYRGMVIGIIIGLLLAGAVFLIA